jgi:hypothetical protein
MPFREAKPIAERPMEFFIGFLCLLSGLPMAILGVAPDSATHYMPAYLIRLWGLGLTLGGGCVVAGILIRYSKERFFIGLMVERSGYWPLITGTTVFSIVIIFRAGWDGLFPILTYVAFAVVCWLRQRQIYRLVHRVTKLTSENE